MDPDPGTRATNTKHPTQNVTNDTGHREETTTPTTTTTQKLFFILLVFPTSLLYFSAAM